VGARLGISSKVSIFPANLGPTFKVVITFLVDENHFDQKQSLPKLGKGHHFLWTAKFTRFGQFLFDDVLDTSSQNG
jgi:hypothetical protein